MVLLFVRELPSGLWFMGFICISVLIVEQRVKTALEISHRVLLMENGMIKWEGLPEELSKNPEALYKYLGVSV